ncbi:MAG: Flp family type IVb pilin [Pseudomonadota bacterium]|nr:Flp family type IVb pilin [Pseudomonadota bacterium]
MDTRFHRFLLDDAGATATEYGFVASLVAVAMVGLLLALGPTLSSSFLTAPTSP